MSIYTKFGDKGKTSLYGDKTVSKASLRVEAYGNLDELNSFLGIVLTELKDKKIKEDMLRIQNDLFEIGSSIASISTIKHRVLSQYLKKRVGEFEKEIDNLTKKLPELENFILPGGSVTGSRLHFARTVARRAERRIVSLAEKEQVLSEVLVYLNRLSDLLFMYARFINYKEKQKEIKWVSG
ncbi:MAG: ATP:cob(I)alamin adenosyltransferase [Candidatus Levybacteria bacterium CG10_big_fil_rev_8_21_14_0_10_35_13]|nr:MAG: ATP:cob(I)alamin adenosyltransferase [Candidatus Levybacteria bacterium CG10_big_fil_rev_8_21_14_0_10_35_13]